MALLSDCFLLISHLEGWFLKITAREQTPPLYLSHALACMLTDMPCMQRLESSLNNRILYSDWTKILSANRRGDLHVYWPKMLSASRRDLYGCLDAYTSESVFVITTVYSSSCVSLELIKSLFLLHTPLLFDSHTPAPTPLHTGFSFFHFTFKVPLNAAGRQSAVLPSPLLCLELSFCSVCPLIHLLLCPFYLCSSCVLIFFPGHSSVTVLCSLLIVPQVHCGCALCWTLTVRARRRAHGSNS